MHHNIKIFVSHDLEKWSDNLVNNFSFFNYEEITFWQGQ